MTFVTTSENMENCLSFIRQAETLAKNGENEKARAELRKAAALATIWQMDLRPFESDLSRVSDSVASHGPGRPFFKSSVHEAVGSLGLQIDSLAGPTDFVVPPDLCGFLKVNLSELRAGLQRERASLQRETVWLKQADDLRISRTRLMLSPATVREEIPLTPQAAELVHKSRRCVEAILDAKDTRMLVVVGPCSIHDPVGVGLDADGVPVRNVSMAMCVGDD